MEITENWVQKGLQINSFGRGIIATCPTPPHGGVFECAANARLIAAAPQLLEALENLYTEIGMHFTGKDDAIERDLKNVMQQAEAAITAAKGE